MTNFPLVPLGSVALVQNGKTPARSEQREAGHPVLKIKDVDEFGRFRGRFESFVEPSLADKFRQKSIKAGDILTLNAAHNAGYVGSKVFRATDDVVGALATGEWLIVRPDKKQLDPNYAFHWMTSERTRRAVKQLVNGIHL